MFGKIKDSKILDEADICLTGAAFHDYDGNGETDMIVCLYEDNENSDSYTDGCLYLFMNDDAPYYIYDDFCCYYHGNIFGDFGADIDHDGNIEIVFCIQGTGVGGLGDCQKFVIKYRDNNIERMELPNDFIEDEYDSGLRVEIEKDTESGKYNIYCPCLDERIVLKTEEDEGTGWDSGANSRGYYSLIMTWYEGRQLLTGYEYIYAGDIANRLGNAVFVFDWDEDGNAFVYDWYVEDLERRSYAPFDWIWLKESGDRKIFSESETGEEVIAYEEFLTGKRGAVIADSIYTDTSYRGEFLTNFYFLIDLLDEIVNEIIEDYRLGKIGEVQYALIDCGNDGKKQLALRAYGLGIDSWQTGSSALTMVFDYKEGTVSMVYAVDTWARSDNHLYNNGYVFGGGSGGASCHSTWEGIIGADGIYHKSYELHVHYGEGLYGMSSYSEVWDINSKRGFPAGFCEYTINDEMFYSYFLYDDVTDEEKEIVLGYIRNNEELMGVKFLTSEEIGELVDENRTRLKITDGMDADENEINWLILK